MPERNILLIRQTNDLNGFYYYATINQETGRALNLNKSGKDKIGATINSIIDSKGNLHIMVNKDYIFDAMYYENKIGYYTYGIKIDPQVVMDYGIREDEYLDLVFNFLYENETRIEIFPKYLRNGQFDIKPKDLEQEMIDQDILFDFNFNESYYDYLILEINYCYAYGLYRSTMILTRVLIENLLIDILRLGFGMGHVNLFYDRSKGRHHSFSTLLENIRINIVKFKPLIQSFDENFLNKIDKLRVHVNANAHTLEMDTEKEKLIRNKENIRNVCKLLITMKNKVKETPIV